jgi:hypothetical protein
MAPAVEMRARPRGDFKIKNISAELNENFSKRHRQIDEKTQELLARGPENANGNVVAIREYIAHRERLAFAKHPKICSNSRIYYAS